MQEQNKQVEQITVEEVIENLKDDLSKYLETKELNAISMVLIGHETML